MFDYFKPSTVEEAYSLLTEYGEEAKILSGGTALLVYLQQRLCTPKYVMSLKGIPGLDHISYDRQEGLRIGALATIDSLSASSIIKGKYPILCQAAEDIGVPAVRQMGTIGGNLCLDTRCIYYNQSYSWRQVRPPCFKRGGNLCYAVKGGDRCFAVYQGDLAAALIALETKVKLVKTSGEKVIPLSEFFTGRGENPNVLKPDELLTEIQLPCASESSAGAYQKLRIRGAIDFPLAGVAVVLDVDEGKVCRKARIVLSAVASAPLEVTGAEKVLKGKRVEEGLIEEAAEEALKKAHPLDNLSIDAGYRRGMVRVLLKRAVKQALGQ